MKKLMIMLAICYVTGGIVIAQNAMSPTTTKSKTTTHTRMKHKSTKAATTANGTQPVQGANGIDNNNSTTNVAGYNHDAASGGTNSTTPKDKSNK